MIRKSLVCAVALVVCSGLAMADEVQLQFFADGALVQNVPVAVVDANGITLQKLPAAPDGLYTADLELGKKIVFRIDDPSLGTLNRQEIRVPELIQGPIDIDLPIQPQGPGAANDECVNAEAVALAAGGSATASGSTTGATIEGPEIPDCPGGTITAPGVWYSVAGTGNTITASTCNLNSAGDADFDTKLSVYCLGCDPATCVAANDDTQDGTFCGFAFTSTVSWGSQVGADYNILVHGFGTATGNFTLALDDDGVAAPPTVDCIPPDPTGACCTQLCNDPVFGECTIETEADCIAGGGEYQGDDVACAIPNGNVSATTSTPNVEIPDGAAPIGVEDTITLMDDPGCAAIADLDVQIVMTHSWIGDVSIDVTGPSGKTSNMWDRRCGNTDNMDFTFDDEGTDLSCAIVAAPGVGAGPPSVAGLGPAFSQFDGDAPAGDWTVFLSDAVGADVGTLNAWVLDIDCGDAACQFAGPGPGPGGKKGDDDDESGSGDGRWNLDATAVGAQAGDGAIIDLNLRLGNDEQASEQAGRSRVGRRLPRR